jgi:peptidoglycan/LPS O-acetylase OafA/YrhL
VPATILFAWVFFWFCEKPYMRKVMQREPSADYADFTDEKMQVTGLEPESA